MGRSWVVALELTVPNKKKWLARKLVAAEQDWPEPLGSGAPSGDPVSKLLGWLSKDAFSRVAWDGDDLTVSAFLSNDSGMWSRRLDLVEAVHGAGRDGGKGQLAIVNALDNTEEAALLVTTDGAVKSLKGAERTKLQKRMRKLEESLGNAVLEREDAARRARPLMHEPTLQPIHAEVLRVLRAANGAKLLEAASSVKSTLTLMPRAGESRTQATLAELHPTADELLVGLERGDARVHAWCAGQYVAVSLEILSLVDEAEALRLSKLALDAMKGKVKGGSSNAFLDLATSIVSARSDGDVASELRTLRKAMPTANVTAKSRLRAHPMVVRLASSRSAETRSAVVTQITKVLGSPPEWRALVDKDASYGFVLTHLLAEQQNAEDAPLLAALYAHPHWMIADRMKAAESARARG